MRTLKLILVFLCLWSASSAVLGIWEIYVHGAGAASSRFFLGTISSAFVAALCGAAIYGIHKRAPITWKLGWALIAAELLELPKFAFSATAGVPNGDDPNVAVAAVIVGGAMVVLYWGWWWNRQKGYFAKPTGPSDLQE